MVDRAQERLIESTRELLWERGYVATSPRAIQRRANAGQGSMYHHFDGKADLALAALSRSAESLRVEAEAQLGLPGTAVARISAYLRRERDALRGCPVGGLAQDPEVFADGRLRRPLAETFEWMRRRVASIVEEGVSSGELAGGLDPLETADCLLAVLQGGYVLARAAGSPEPFERAIRGALGLLRAGAA